MGSYLGKYYQWLGAAPQIIDGYYSLAESSHLSEHLPDHFSKHPGICIAAYAKETYFM